MLTAALLSAMWNPSKAEPDDWSMFPGDSAVAVNGRHVHDPTVVEIGGKAFCFSTSGNGFTVVRSSPDLKNWTELGPIFKEHPAWLTKRFDHRSIWAPDIVVLGKTVRMYYSASTFGSNTSLIGLAECPNFDPLKPLEGWIDRGLVIETRSTDDANAIDAEVVIGTDGRHWMHYGSYWGGVFVVELNPVTGKLLGADTPRVCVAKNTTERGNPLEGSAVLSRGGYYYLFVSYGLAAQGVRSTYRIMVGRSLSPQGPFVDPSGKSMADGGHLNVLKTSPPMMSPGHCDVLTLRDGRTVMPYHYYDARQIWHGDTWGMPTLQIRELLWSNDGWPLPGLPIEAERPPQGSSLAGKWLQQIDFGQPEVIELRADGASSNGGSWVATGSEFQFNSKQGARPFRARIQLAYGNGYFVGRTENGLIIRGYRLRQK